MFDSRSLISLNNKLLNEKKSNVVWPDSICLRRFIKGGFINKQFNTFVGFKSIRSAFFHSAIILEAIIAFFILFFKISLAI